MRFFIRRTKSNIFDRRPPFGQVQAFGAVRGRAYKFLQEPHHKATILHLWELPSFDDPRSWTVFFASIHEAAWPDEAPPPYLKEMQWDHRHDHNRFFEEEGTNRWHTNPRLITRKTELDWGQFLTLFNEAKALNIPVFGLPDQIGLKGAGLDGTRFGLSIPDVGLGIWAGSVRLTWWGDSSPAWQPVAAWFHKMVTFFTESLNDAE